MTSRGPATHVHDVSVNRDPRGVPSGGQFAPRILSEPDVSLAVTGPVDDTAVDTTVDTTDDPFAFDDDPTWESLGYSPHGAAAWTDAGVASPEVALRCENAGPGMRPHHAAHTWETVEARGEAPETITIGRAVESGFISDEDLPAVATWIVNRSAAHSTLLTYGSPITHREQMQKAAEAAADLLERGIRVPEFNWRSERVR